MVLDASALLAILQDEPERERFVAAIEAAAVCALSVANWLEASIVIETRRGSAGVRELELFIATARIALAPVDLEQGQIARDAHRRFGKGRHPAGLNFGDCFAYALTQLRGEPLLFKGEGFMRTDVERHAASG